MVNRRRFALAALVVACVGASAIAPGAAATTTSEPTIVYGDRYLKLMALYPSGWVLDSCRALLEVTGRSGVCTDMLQLEYIYPDGTFGKMPWYADASSPTGWSVEPDPCVGLTDEENALWVAYVDWVNGYSETGPNLSAEQIDRYGACWGWWF